MTTETENNDDDRPVVDELSTCSQHDDDKDDDTAKEVTTTMTTTGEISSSSPSSSNTKNEMTNENDDENKNSPQTTNDEKENNEYDIVIVGTGLVESILSCALTMQNFKVLHIDEQDYYGQQDATLTLSDLIKWSKQHLNSFDRTGIQIHSSSGSNTNATPHYFVGKHVLMNPYGRGIVIEYHDAITIEKDGDSDTTATAATSTKLCRLVVELLPSTLSSTTTRSKAIISFQWNMDLTSSSSVQTQVQPLTQLYLNQIIQNPRYDRMCAFDLNAVRGSLVLSNGMAVSSLLKSKVSEYLEFKAIDKLQIVLSDDKNQNVILTPVPCHKSDVFNSKLLQPLEKRKLMKLLQLVLEYEEYQQEQEQQQKHSSPEEEQTTLNQEDSTIDEVLATTTTTNDGNADADNETSNNNKDDNKTSVPTTKTTTIDNYNERHLRQRGKSLKRPQNKKAATSALQTLLDTYIVSSETSFEEYLQKEHKMSFHLISIICHALCLSVQPCANMTVANGFNMLTTHMNSLGKFGSTAFITPLYGCGELSQAYCRKSAVLGTTYMLRQSLSKIHYDDQKDSSSDHKNDDDGMIKTNITGVTLKEVVEGGGEFDKTTAAEETTEIKCSRVILGSSSFCTNTNAIDEGPSQALAAGTPTTTTLNRISLIYISDDTLGINAAASGSASSVIQTLLAQSLIVVVPPFSSTSKNAVFISFKNHLVNVCCPPSNYLVVHMSTISSDTSTSDQTKEEYMKHVLQNVLRGAIGAATAAAAGGNKSKTTTFKTATAEEGASATFNLINNVELFHVCYSTRSSSSSSSTTSTTSSTPTKTNNGLYKVESPTLDNQGISIDGYFQKAKQLFDQILNDGSSSDTPPPVFLEMSTSLQKELEEAQKGYGTNKEQGAEEEEEDDDM